MSDYNGAERSAWFLKALFWLRAIIFASSCAVLSSLSSLAPSLALALGRRFPASWAASGESMLFCFAIRSRLLFEVLEFLRINFVSLFSVLLEASRDGVRDEREPVVTRPRFCWPWPRPELVVALTWAAGVLLLWLSY